MNLESLRNVFSNKGAAESNAQLADLRRLVLEKQAIEMRIQKLTDSMSLVGSDKSMRDSSDESLLEDLGEEKMKLAKDIYETCQRSGEDCGRFLSEFEIQQSADDNELNARQTLH
ncbi:MAG TPA: hypothetical protein VK254_00965 [Candidatus Bathyarchaeia archaeon]|nr:hypothetical protein [Candidatus Bathyarchaeia archaeon]